MARIQTYDLDVDIDDNDKLVGTDGAVGAELNKTKNFTLLSIKKYVQSPIPYKVYTALLTRPSGGNALTSIVNASLTVGVTYVIADDDSGSGHDFTNVGAPNNNFGTYFVATGTTPARWGTNVFLQYNTGAPTVRVLQNNVGNVYFSYVDTGEYSIVSDQLFTLNKTYISFGGFYGGVNFVNDYVNPGFIAVYGSDSVGLDNVPIEIRVYD